MQTMNWRFYELNFIFFFSCLFFSHTILFILCSFACFLLSFLLPVMSLSPFIFVVYFVYLLVSVRSLSYLFFFLRCSVSSFPSRAPFLYPSLVLLSLFPVSLPSLFCPPFCLPFAVVRLQFRARRAGDRHDFTVARPELTSAVLKVRSHSSGSLLTVDRASISRKFPVC